MLTHVERFVLEYADQRRKEGNADFEDLLIRSRDLVRDNPLVREHFRRRSTHVLVDEFQDTDPIQAELIAWISAPPGADGDWRDVVPEPGSLFVVGDPKQSIYRFRGADIAAYDAVKRGPLAGRLERLEQNFRSTESVLGWVNELFDRVFVEQPGIQPANTHLIARDTTIDRRARPLGDRGRAFAGRVGQDGQVHGGDARGGVLAAGAHDLACRGGGAVAGSRSPG